MWPGGKYIKVLVELYSPATAGFVGMLNLVRFVTSAFPLLSLADVSFLHL
jgi:hypothetical protein